jgi:hypothetical protein
MTICLLGRDADPVDRADAGIIALRIMKGSEAEDFDIDPRGILPPRMEAAFQRHVDRMIEFTYGHEYAHALLGHVAANGSTPLPIQDSEHKVYSHELEYAADLHAVKRIGGDRAERAAMARAAYYVFLYLHVIELMSASHPDAPSFSVSRTHPTPCERLWRLLESLKDWDQRPRLEVAVRTAGEICDLLLERICDIGRNDVLTMYGSIYLQGLGGKLREDRVDF